MQPKPFFAALLAMLVFVPAALSAACDLNSAGNTVFSSNVTCEGGMGNTTGNITINDGVYVEFRGATLNLTGTSQSIFVEGALTVNRSFIDHAQPTSVEGWYLWTANSDAPLRILKSRVSNSGVIFVRKSGSVIDGLVINNWANTGGVVYGGFSYAYQAAISAYRNITSLTFNNITFNAVKRPAYGILLNRTSGVRMTNLVMNNVNKSSTPYFFTDGISNFTRYENITVYSAVTLYAINSFQSVNDYPRWKNITIRNIKVMNGSNSALFHFGSGNALAKAFNNLTIENVVARKNISAGSSYIWIVQQRMRTANFSCFVRDVALYDYYYYSSGMKQPYRFSAINASGIGYCVLINATAFNTTANAYAAYPYDAGSSARFLYYFQPRIAGSVAGGKLPIDGANITIASKRFGLNTSVLTNADGRPYGTGNNLIYALNVSAGTANRFRFNVSVTKGAYTNTTQMLINNSNINMTIMLQVPSAINIYSGFTNRTVIRKDRNFRLNATIASNYLDNESVYARFSNSTWAGAWLKLRNASSANPRVFGRVENITLKTGQYYFVTFNASDTLGNTSALDGTAIWVYDECTINATRPMAYMRFNAVCSGSYNVVGNLTIEDGATVEFRNAELRMNANNQSVYVRGVVIFNRTVVKKAGTLKTQFWDLRERASADAPLRVIKSYFNSMRYFFPSKSKPMVDGAYLNESRFLGIYINASHNGVFRNITISPYASSFGAINPDGAGTLLNTTFDGMVINSHNVVLPYLVVISQGSTSINRLYARNINVKNAQSIVYLYGGYGSVIVKNITVENVVGTTVGYSAAVSANPLYYLADNSGGDNAPIKNVILRNWNLRHNASNASLNNHAYLGVTAPCAGYVYYAGVRNFTLEDMELYDYNYNKSGALYMPFVLTTTPVLANTDEFVLRNITVYNTTSGLPVDFPYYACAGTYDQQRFVNYWYFQPNVTYSNGTAVEGANITLSSKRFGDKSFLTQANGVPYGTSDSLFLGVRVNGTAVTGYRYNVTVLKLGYVSNSTDNILINNSNWGALGFTLQEIPPKRLIAVMSTPSGNSTSLSVNFNYAARTDAGNAHVAYCNLTKNGTVVRRDFSVANGSAENITYGFGAGDNYRCFVMRVSCATNETSPTSNSSGGAVICIAQYGLPENNWNMPSLLSLILALGIAAVALFTAFDADMGDKETTVRAAIGILFLMFALLIAFGA